MDEREADWTHQDSDGKMTLYYERLPVKRYVGGRYPYTKRCPTCGKTSLRNQHHFVHIAELALNAKREPELRSVVFCPVPAILSDAQRRAMKALHEHISVEVEKSTWESLEKRGLVSRAGREERKLTRSGELLVEEEW